MKKSNEQVIKWLEREFLSVDQLSKTKVKDSNEELVDLNKTDSFIILSPQENNLKYTGKTIFVRLEVAKKLKNINKRFLKNGLALKVTDGYRPIEVQKEYWQWHMERSKKKFPKLSKKKLESVTLKFCAKPELAYHTTGGAVDTTIVNLKTDKELPMGTKIDQFSHKAYTYYPYLSKKILLNRQMLYQEMGKEGFYNFPSEWWHFSYGTRDWALYYRQSYAIYDVIKL